MRDLLLLGPWVPPPPVDATPPDLDTVVDAFVVADEDRPAGAYHLSRLPVLGTIRVIVNPDRDGPPYELHAAAGDPPVGDWIYDASMNAVRFMGVLPGPGAAVTITYERLDALAGIATRLDRRDG